MLPVVLINKILEYKSEICNNSWIPYLDKNDKIKFKINKYANRNNIKNVLLHKLNNPPTNILIELDAPLDNYSIIETTTTICFLYYNKNNVAKYFMVLYRKDKNQYDYLYYQYGIYEENEENYEFKNGFYFENRCHNNFDKLFHYSVLNNITYEDPSREVTYMYPKIINDDDVLEIGITGPYLLDNRMI